MISQFNNQFLDHNKHLNNQYKIVQQLPVADKGQTIAVEVDVVALLVLSRLGLSGSQPVQPK